MTTQEARVWVATVVIYCPCCPRLIPAFTYEDAERDRWGHEIARHTYAETIWSPEGIPDRITCPYCGWEGPVSGSLDS